MRYRLGILWPETNVYRLLPCHVSGGHDQRPAKRQFDLRHFATFVRHELFTDGRGGIRLFRSALYHGFWIVLGRLSLLVEVPEWKVLSMLNGRSRD